MANNPAIFPAVTKMMAKSPENRCSFVIFVGVVNIYGVLYYSALQIIFFAVKCRHAISSFADNGAIVSLFACFPCAVFYNVKQL